MKMEMGQSFLGADNNMNTPSCAPDNLELGELPSSACNAFDEQTILPCYDDQTILYPQELDGIRKGVRAYCEGKVRPWPEVKKELGLH